MISVILPIYHEEASIGGTLQRLKEQAGSYEVIVVDGGSEDQSLEVARSCAQQFPQWQVLSAQKGRANQMNVGVREAKGDILLFLHADCWLEKGTLTAIEEAMQKENVVGGCLTQKIEASHPYYRWLELTGNIRARLFRIFYGDQAIFIRREIFDKIEGYPPIPLFEDLAFSRRLRREGKTAVLSKQVVTSPRRWERKGMLRGSLQNLFILFLYGLGISPQRLARFYPDVR